METSLSTIPDYIEAGSPTALRSLMLKTNVRYKKSFNYYDIQHFSKRGKVRWIAWFLRPMSNLELSQDEKLNDVTE